METLLLISGAGRNVGKTTLACHLIEKYKKYFSISAVKISSHFHDLTPCQKIAFQEEGLIISEEQDRISSKDSSRYLQAGADHAIYIQSTTENIPLVVQWMKENLNGLVICESASLEKAVIPDQAIFVSSSHNEKQPGWQFPYETTQMVNGVFTPEISFLQSPIKVLTDDNF